jgi:hypothetical protein
MNKVQPRFDFRASEVDDLFLKKLTEARSPFEKHIQDNRLEDEALVPRDYLCHAPNISLGRAYRIRCLPKRLCWCRHGLLRRSRFHLGCHRRSCSTTSNYRLQSRVWKMFRSLRRNGLASPNTLKSGIGRLIETIEPKPSATVARADRLTRPDHGQFGIMGCKLRTSHLIKVI